jgi:integrase/recombinase XerD
MANKEVSIVVRGQHNGKRVNWSVERARREGLVGGVYWLKFYQGAKQCWDGPHNDLGAAVAGRIRKERELRGGVIAAPTPGRRLLSDAVKEFVHERTLFHGVAAAKRWKWELDRFLEVCTKPHLDEIVRADVLAYWRFFKDRGAAPRTIFNRVQSLLTFFKHFNITGLLKPTEMPQYDEKDVDYYNEHNPNELSRFFTACDPEEHLAFSFFLYTGAREREVMFACWNDIDFTHRTFTMRPKLDLGFTTKNGLTRVIPIPQLLVDALKTYVLTIPSRRLVFTSSNGKAEGHFLITCKEIAFRAGLNCGYCVNRKGLACKDHPVCSKWSLHKFRRTFATFHLWNGVPITTVQAWIGHSDLETLNRYVAKISPKSDMAKQMAENMVRMTQTHGAVSADSLADTVRV